MGDSRFNRHRTLLAAALVPGWLLTVLFSGCANDPAKSAAPVAHSLAVRVVRVEPRPLELGVDVTGSLVSSVAVDVKTEFAGRLISLLKKDGDRVSRGELIAQLEDVNARLSLGQARAALEVARAALDRAQVGEEHAQREFERAQNLLKSGGITDRDLQAAESSARDARAQVKLAQAQVEQSRQTAAQAEKHLNDCRIVSPISGEVDRKFVNPGSWVDGNALLYHVVDNQRLELETNVASSELAALARGQKIRFTVAAFPGQEFNARVLAISPAVQLQNRSVLVRAAVSNPGGTLKAGMFVKGRIVTGVRPSALLVPPEAVWQRPGQPSFLYVVDQNRARRQEVKLGAEQAEGFQILSGLSAGETVVAEQNLELADGVNLSPRP
ncbi:MAG: efflux RND transporter periplasmic adaptor subunit [Terriglobia bacterium]